jgi:hypothetical protein
MVSQMLSKIIQDDRTGGLLWYHYLTRTTRSHLFPTSRTHIISTICSESPKLCHTVLRPLELHEEGKRVLIYVNHPLTLM